MPTKNSKASTTAGGSGTRLKFTPPMRTRDQIIEEGRQVADLLQSAAFNLAWQSAIQSMQDQIIHAEPHESQKREYLNLKIQALGEVAGELKLMYSEAIRLSTASLTSEAARQDAIRRNEYDEVPNTGYDGAYAGERS